jgi:hypothetical protein
MGIGLVKVQLKVLVRTTIDIELLRPIPSLYIFVSYWRERTGDPKITKLMGN